MTKPRDYKKEYARDHASPKDIAARSNRNKATRKLKREGKGSDGKEIDHKDGNPMNNARSNLRVVSRKTNRKKG